LVVLDGPDRRAHPHLPTPPPAGATIDPVHDVWHELQGRSIDFLDSITLAALVERGRAETAFGSYSI
jgi:DNA-binding IscR family transcriptional regulator